MWRREAMNMIVNSERTHEILVLDLKKNTSDFERLKSMHWDSVFGLAEQELILSCFL